MTLSIILALFFGAIAGFAGFVVGTCGLLAIKQWQALRKEQRGMTASIEQFVEGEW